MEETVRLGSCNQEFPSIFSRSLYVIDIDLGAITVTYPFPVLPPGYRTLMGVVPQPATPIRDQQVNTTKNVLNSPDNHTLRDEQHLGDQVFAPTIYPP